VPMLLEAFLPDAWLDEDVSDRGNDNHLYCECRPTLVFCGKIDDSQWEGFADQLRDDEICPPCLVVSQTTGCPICGCREFNLCRACESTN
jgi:hypothetical protein